MFLLYFRYQCYLSKRLYQCQNLIHTLALPREVLLSECHELHLILHFSPLIYCSSVRKSGRYQAKDNSQVVSSDKKQLHYFSHAHHPHGSLYEFLHQMQTPLVIVTTVGMFSLLMQSQGIETWISFVSCRSSFEDRCRMEI